MFALPSGLSRQTMVAITMLACSLNVQGAVRYRFESKTISGWTRNSRGTVVLDGSRSRVNIDLAPDEVLTHDVEIHDGTRRLGVDRIRKSWFEIKPADLRWTMFTIPMGERHKVSKLVVKLDEQESEKASPLRRHTLRFSYTLVGNIQGVTVKASVVTVAKFVTDNSRSVERLPMDPRDLGTGLAQVDQAVGRELRVVSGFPIEANVVITRQIEGGQPFAEIRYMKISDIEEVAANPTLFEVPKGYENREPEIGSPGS